MNSEIILPGISRPDPNISRQTPESPRKIEGKILFPLSVLFLCLLACGGESSTLVPVATMNYPTNTPVPCSVQQMDDCHKQGGWIDAESPGCPCIIPTATP